MSQLFCQSADFAYGKAGNLCNPADWQRSVLQHLFYHSCLFFNPALSNSFSLGAHSFFIHNLLYDIAHVILPLPVSLVILHRPSQKIIIHIFRLCTSEIMHQLLHLITS